MTYIKIYQDISTNYRNIEKIENNPLFLKCSRTFLVSFGAAGAGFRVIPDQKISKTIFGPKSVFFDQRKPPDRPGPGKKNSKNFRPTNYRPGSRHPAPGPGSRGSSTGIRNFDMDIHMDIVDWGSLRPRVLEAQVPSVPRSHRSQGPIGPPKVSHRSHPRDPWEPIYSMDISIWIYPYRYIHMDISIWIYPYG